MFLIGSDELEEFKEVFGVIANEANGVKAIHAPQAAQVDINFRRDVELGTFFRELLFEIIINRI